MSSYSRSCRSPSPAITFFLNRGFARSSLVFATLLSLAFYAYWNVNYVPLLVLSVVVNFHLGRVLIEGKTRHRNIVAAIGVFLNLAALGYFKYANFFVDQVEHLTSQAIDLPTVIMPLAISFYTFEQIASPSTSTAGTGSGAAVSQTGLYASIFPHLIAGPIVRFDEIRRRPHRAAGRSSRPTSALGLSIFLVGLFKKVADCRLPRADRDHVLQGGRRRRPSGPASRPGLARWRIASDLLRLLRLLRHGDRARADVRHPPAAQLPLSVQGDAIIDFWRRWHITLSRFLRDYLYVPLGGNRRGRRGATST